MRFPRLHHTVRHTPADAPMYCRNCGYQLDNLTQPRCPECGQGFQPGDPDTYETEPPESPTRSLGSVILGITITAAIAAVVFLVVFIVSAALRGP